MSPHMNKFIKTPFFMFNSRFDAWQMDNDLQVPCHVGEENHTKCSSAEQAAIVQYGADFIDALQPVIDSAPPKRCIYHILHLSFVQLDRPHFGRRNELHALSELV